MRTAIFFFWCSIICSISMQNKGICEPVICDPLQAINVNVEVVFEDESVLGLKEEGVQTLSLIPSADFSWRKDFPLENGTTFRLQNTADLITLNMQDGLLVTYKTCEGETIYAYCQLPDEQLKGQFPKDVRLHLSPILHQCCIEVLSTQCP
ncbi:MAG: hypothetical protein JSR85_02630 [Proteobacteria bacterium]|nr:hypothetical protein [Pseudomonadota bacterium]